MWGELICSSQFNSLSLTCKTLNALLYLFSPGCLVKPMKQYWLGTFDMIAERLPS